MRRESRKAKLMSRRWNQFVSDMAQNSGKTPRRAEYPREVGGVEEECRIQTLMPEVYSLIQNIVIQNATSLIAERKALASKDQYGREVHDRWDVALRRFYLRSIKPILLERFDKNKLNHADMSTYIDANGLRFASNNSGRRMPLRFMDYIDTVLDECIASLPRESFNVLMSPTEYEHFCARLLIDRGWDVTVSGQTGDQGVDLVARREGTVLVVQCKMYSKPVGNSAVQEIFSGKAMYGADSAAVVACSGFTRAAQSAAAHLSVYLLHHNQLSDEKWQVQ